MWFALYLAVVDDQDMRYVVSNVVAIEPGGYLQWDEMDLTTFHPGVVKASASKVAADELMEKWRSECAKSGIMYE